MLLAPAGEASIVPHLAGTMKQTAGERGRLDCFRRRLADGPATVTQVLSTMQQPSQSHLPALMTIENKVVVEARHEQVSGPVVRISVAPDGANLRVLRQQLHRRVHGLDKPLGCGRI